jgi:hypothetical protein
MERKQRETSGEIKAKNIKQKEREEQTSDSFLIGFIIRKKPHPPLNSIDLFSSF